MLLWNRTVLSTTAAITATLTFWATTSSYVARAHAQDHTDVPAAESTHNITDEGHAPAIDPSVTEDIRPASVDEIQQAAVAEPERQPLPPSGGSILPVTLPTGPGKSAATPQTISLPKAEGSIQGMGESFSPVLSSGTATFNVPIALPPGRAGVQPSLALAYSSSSGNGDVGIGWSLAAPYIARQDDRGLPLYADGSVWYPREDRFFYNGGQELVPVSNADTYALDGQDVPSELGGWQQYRARVEGAFMRFFRHYDTATRQTDRWVVQSKDGTRFDFGVVPAGELPTDFGDSRDSLMSENDDGTGRVYKWQLTRMSDAHGSTVYYRYIRDQKQLYLSDVHYVSPASCGEGEGASARRNCTAALASYGRRVRLEYETRLDAQASYVTTWRVVTGLRLHRVDVTAYHHTPAARTLVRRYHLRYDASSFYSLLTSVQVEGRPGITTGDVTVAESALGDAIVGELLPAMTFEYSGLDSGVTVPSFGALSAEIHTAAGSPNHSVDETRTDLFDVNSDGLPDIITTDPATYRTVDGAPAVGVFFNGFHGRSATPSTPGDFSDAVPVAAPPGFDSVMTLSNLNVNPMDIDGDGRSDLLHMPRVRDYDYFTPVRTSASSTVVDAMSPAQQTWAFARVPVSLPVTDTDPRIDFGRDASHIRTLDVNGDSLIDVVRTTGTEMQTWLNLGWVPSVDGSGRALGDGRFGSATWDGTRWNLSTLPYESCLMHEGLPLDFEDPNVQLADMNGDGLQDIVHIERGRLYYWAGRGTALWGEGSSTCAATDPGAGRTIEVASPPLFDIGGDGVYLEDVNADGAADAVQVRYHAVDVWLNEGGTRFTGRYTISSADMPYAPSYVNRIRFTDIDGSGTPDLVWANAGRYQWLDFMGGVKPRLLTVVHNGLGAETDLTYGSSATEYLRDLASCTSTGCHRWSGARVACMGTDDGSCDLPDAKTGGYRSGGSPVISTVVTQVSTTDHFDRVGREANVMTTRFAYHDGYYEGVEQEFRGFGSAEATAVGDEASPTSVTHTTFLQGRRPNAIASSRLADNPDEALKGRESLTEVSDETGAHWLSTTHAGYVVRRLLTGLNGYTVTYAYVGTSDELKYTNVSPSPGADVLELSGITRQLSDATTDSTYPPVTDTVHIRISGYAHMQNTIDSVDGVGNLLQQTAHGRILGEYGETILDGTIDNEAITTYTTPTAVADAESMWLWRTGSTHLSGGDGEGGSDTFTTPTPATTYNEVGDLLDQTQGVNLTAPAYEFGGDTTGSDSYSQTNETVETSSTYDAWGNATGSCAGADIADDPTDCLRRGAVTYDSTFNQFPTSEKVYTSTAAYLATSADWDEGLGVLVSATDPNEKTTSVTYDGLGRLTSVTPPKIGPGCSTAAPTTTIDYALTTSGDSDPVSHVHAVTRLDCDDPGEILEAFSYVDGLGRVRASVATGPDTDTWVQSGITLLTARGTPRRAFHSAFITATDARAAVVIPSTDHTDAMYDAFGRVVASFAEDGAMTTTAYQALTTDVCDPLDNDCDNETTRHTCTTTRTDGHGRVIDQIQRNRQPDDPGHETEYQRLWSYYRADGALVWLVRAKTAVNVPRPVDLDLTVAMAHVQRHFTYDTAGRRLGATDPDTDSRDGDCDETNCTWRYLFNNVGDLAAVRDPRGCGQNFFYDVAGRLVGEDYVLCDEAQAPSATSDDWIPDGAIGMAPTSPEPVDVLYTFDSYESCPISLGGGQPSLPAGRATCVSDRGQRSTVAYDGRGNAVWTARQMAVIDPGIATPTESSPLSGNPPAVFDGDAMDAGTRIYDTAHTYERTATFDYANRPVSMTLPDDPDYPGDGGVPHLGGELTYDHRGLPATATATIDDAGYPIVTSTTYDVNGLVTAVVYGDHQGVDAGTPTVSHTHYDARLRPDHMWTERDIVGSPDAGTLGAVTVPFDQTLNWDTASNLIAIDDNRDEADWTAGHEPQSVEVTHDALYRVTEAEYTYGGASSPEDTGTDWRNDMAAAQVVDPMRTRPASMIGTPPDNRVMSLTWSYDWLGNMTDWEDDADAFYERSIGQDLRNGYANDADHDRASALYFASNLPTSAPTWIDGKQVRGSYLEVAYGQDGNVVSMAVHANCEDHDSGHTCYAPSDGASSADRLAAAHAGCSCGAVQYQYRWDELNRLAEARRYSGPDGFLSLQVVQRMLYDSANQRTVKAIFDQSSTYGFPAEKAVLYVYPGDFERRGLARDTGDYESYASYAVAGESTSARSEAQYLVGGARIVWATASPGGGVDPDARITVPLSDLLGTTSAVVDLRSGELLDANTYYPNGARETYASDGAPFADASAPPEPAGFTGKEGDEELGLVYFGERYLISRIGRWSSPDPVSVHSLAGGQPLNDFHYVAGNMLGGRDALGLDWDDFFRSGAQAGGRGGNFQSTIDAGRELNVALNNWTGGIAALVHGDTRKAQADLDRAAEYVQDHQPRGPRAEADRLFSSDPHVRDAAWGMATGATSQLVPVVVSEGMNVEPSTPRLSNRGTPTHGPPRVSPRAAAATPAPLAAEAASGSAPVVLEANSHGMALPAPNDAHAPAQPPGSVATVRSSVAPADPPPAEPPPMELDPAETWGNPDSLQDHFERHGADFGARSPQAYARMASEFLQRAIRDGLPMKVDGRGVIRVYDAGSNTFGAYNANGTTRTFYSPNPAEHGFPTNTDYWNAQPGAAPTNVTPSPQ